MLMDIPLPSASGPMMWAGSTTSYSNCWKQAQASTTAPLSQPSSWGFAVRPKDCPTETFLANAFVVAHDQLTLADTESLKSFVISKPVPTEMPQFPETVSPLVSPLSWEPPSETLEGPCE